jgi:hypothetical protein
LCRKGCARLKYTSIKRQNDYSPTVRVGSISALSDATVSTSMSSTWQTERLVYEIFRFLYRLLKATDGLFRAVNPRSVKKKRAPT